MPAEAEVVVAASPAGVLDPAPMVDSKSKPFEDPSSLVDTTVSDSDADPLDSPTTSNYFARSDTEYDPEEDPSGDDSSDENTSGVDEQPSFRIYPHLLPRHYLFPCSSCPAWTGDTQTSPVQKLLLRDMYDTRTEEESLSSACFVTNSSSSHGLVGCRITITITTTINLTTTITFTTIIILTTTITTTFRTIS
ncbi:hypothetical protein Tco_0145976 [Tanacetum coccineum]